MALIDALINANDAALKYREKSFERAVAVYRVTAPAA